MIKVGDKIYSIYAGKTFGEIGVVKYVDTVKYAGPSSSDVRYHVEFNVASGYEHNCHGHCKYNYCAYLSLKDIVTAPEDILKHMLDKELK